MCSVSAMSAVSSARTASSAGSTEVYAPSGALLAVLAGQQVDPSEEEVLELVVEPVEMDSGPEHLRVAFGERAGGADLAAFGGVVHQELRLVDLLFEAAVDLVEMFLLDGDLTVADGVGARAGREVLPRRVHGVAYGVVSLVAYGIDYRSSGFNSGILRGHRGPLLTCTGQPSTVREGGGYVRPRPPPDVCRRMSGPRSGRCRRGPWRRRRARTAGSSPGRACCPGGRNPTSARPRR